MRLRVLSPPLSYQLCCFIFTSTKPVRCHGTMLNQIIIKFRSPYVGVLDFHVFFVPSVSTSDIAYFAQVIQ
jgi:hypothetical protein